jgi:hypothetical protein
MPNSIVDTQFSLLDQMFALRHALWEMLTDDDLAFTPDGANPTLGELCRTMGDYDVAYAESFRTFIFNADDRHADVAVETSVERLKVWFAMLETDFKAAIEALSQEAVDGTLIDRGGGMQWPVMVQFHVYREGLLIFYGKLSVYLKALDKPLNEQWQTWIG